MLFKPSNTVTYGMKKDNFISVSITIPEITSTKYEKKMDTPVAKTKDTTENIDINNLFSDVWTKEIESKKEINKPKDTRRMLEIEKKIKTTTNNDVESLSSKIDSYHDIKSEKENDASSTGDEVNEYLAKIQGIVYEHFNVPSNSQGNSVKTVIELNAFGKVTDFRILTYSSNTALNEEADRVKARIMNVVFPINPQNRSSRTIVILISKE